MFPIASFSFVGGLLAGSFLSVVAHRVPRGDSIVAPRSHCPACGTQIAAYDNVPVLSWLLLRGRCRHCHTRIPVRYPAIELAVGVAFALTTVLLWDEPAELALGLVLVSTLAAVTLTDLESRVIPNAILVVAAAIGLGIVVGTDPASLPERLLAALAAGGFLLAAALIYPQGMGMGDVKLAAVIGLFLGSAVAPAMVVALAAGAASGVVLMIRYGARARKQAVPFGPFLALGGLVGLLAGNEIVDWYLGTFMG